LDARQRAPLDPVQERIARMMDDLSRRDAETSETPDRLPDVIYLPDQSQPRPSPRLPGRRARVPDPRTARFDVRCTPGFRARVEADARAAGLSVSGFVCARLGEHPSPRARRIAPADHAALVKLLAELGKIGSNHNQLARIFNTIGETPDHPEWVSIERDIQAMRRALLKALGHGD
jgi:hypothetical protein